MSQEMIVLRIGDQALDCVVYLYPSRQAAEAGDSIGGSGFLLGVQSKPRPHEWWYYAVTNAHVIDNGRLVIRLNTKDGKTDFIETTRDQWEFHPSEDLAICEIKPKDVHKTAVIPSTLLAQEVFTRTDPTFVIGTGSDVAMLGRYISHDGKQRNWPSVRFGAISLMPHEPIYNSHTHQSHPAFLVEVRSMGGYSGSPVLAFVPRTRQIEIPDEMDQTRVEYRHVAVEPSSDEPPALLLGVVSSHIEAGAPVSLDTQEWGGREASTTEFFTEFNTGMAVVIPAWKLQDLLNVDRFKMKRQKEETAAVRRARETRVKLDDSSGNKNSQRSRAGKEIPIPTRGQFEKDLTKAIRRKRK